MKTRSQSPFRGVGRDATSPEEIPKKGWRDIFKRVYSRSLQDGISFDAAAVAFYFLLALVPAIAATVAIYGLVADQSTVVEHVSLLRGVLPPDVLDLIATEMQNLSTSASSGWALAVGLVLAIWGSSKGIAAITDALNRVYCEQERRSFIRRKANDILLTAALIFFASIVLLLVVIAPAVIRVAGLADSTDGLISLVRWPALFLTVLVAVTFLYRFAPCRKDPKWRWVAPGSLAASLLMVAALVGMSFYASSFGGGFSKTYGSLGAVVLMMLCFYISALALLFGGEINAETEHQTARDSTVGPEKPLGKRGAYMADTVGESQWKPQVHISSIS